MKTSLFLFVLFTPSAFCRWSDGIVGVDFKYNDITSFQLPSNSSLDCYTACVGTDGCAGWVFCPAGASCCGLNATCWLKSSMVSGEASACRVSGYSPSALAAPVFSTPPVGSLQPLGWLADELHLQAAGLTGYLAFFWRDIANSSFIGGGGDTGLHERAPYWLNGLVPASFLTKDANLVALREKYLGYIIAHQASSGWIGVDDMPKDGNQYWSRINIVLSLIQYYEGSQDAAAITCIFNYLGEANRRLSAVPLGGWAAVRAQDWIWGVFWLVDNFDSLQGVPAGYSQAWLISFADLLHSQMLSNNADWKTWFDTPSFPTGPACVKGAPCNMLTHGVNIGQALKSEAVWYRRSKDLTDVASTNIRLEKLDAYHGVPSGMFQADEHLAGKMPSHGTETCAVVEAVVSLAVAGAIIGDPALFERAERVAYNALPASMTKDMWERVYLQASNEADATVQNPHVWYTDGGDSALFSLEGNYGCCTANMHAGWPKFTQRAVGWGSGAVAVLMWAPVSATTPNATVVVDTDFPFGDTATVTVTPTTAAGAAPVPVWLRIPSWAAGATLAVDGGAATPLAGSNGTFFPAATRGGGAASTFVINFNPTIRVETFGLNGAASVFRGPLLYSAWIGQNVSTLRSYAYNSKDLSITSTTPFNLALVVGDRANPGSDLTFQRISPPSPVPFNSTDVPLIITGRARVVAGWGLVDNAPDAPPLSPACAAAGACGDPIPVTLVPFGSTHVRMAVLPTA